MKAADGQQSRRLQLHPRQASRGEHQISVAAWEAAIRECAREPRVLRNRNALKPAPRCFRRG
eukprot:2297065-Pyramimonas_sp.AAC.1